MHMVGSTDVNANAVVVLLQLVLDFIILFHLSSGLRLILAATK